MVFGLRVTEMAVSLRSVRSFKDERSGGRDQPWARGSSFRVQESVWDGPSKLSWGYARLRDGWRFGGAVGTNIAEGEHNLALPHGCTP